MTAEERFIELVKEYQGFEFYQAYREDADHILGGKDDTYWYSILKKGKLTESYIAVYRDGIWHDHYVKVKGSKKTTKELPSGSTIEMIAEKAFFLQEEKWVKDRKPRLIEDSHPHYHYVYGFGDKALDVSDKYGVSIAYSDLKDLSAGFHLRFLYTGLDVEIPQDAGC